MNNFNNFATEFKTNNQVIYTDMGFFQYQKGVYKTITDILVKKKIKEKLADQFSVRNVEEAFKTLQLEAYVCLEDVRTPELNVRNGMLDINTLNLKPHNPSVVSFTQFPIDYDASAECPLFIQSLEEWLQDQDKIDFLQEFMGYCLIHDVSQEKILFLVGSGANGKSTLLHVANALYGNENCSAIPLDKIGNRFYLSELNGKAVNITSETPSGSTLCDDVIKQVVSGDRVQGEKKFKQPFFFTPHVKFIVACNEIPKTSDRSDALYRRIVIIKFNRVYSPSQQDRNLKSKLIAEKSGILNWALVGLKRLLERGYFVEPRESVESREEYRRENNNLMLFIEERCAFSDNGEVSVAGIYSAYTDWCSEEGLTSPLSKPKFGKAIKTQYNLLQDQTGHDRTRVWKGISLS